ncbi:hypothetical protein JKP88DRAFT_243031 [Tribonema minus]|uniref:Uncharacterized protein n=1 Tax=Tribonema minus TaxID=303371 RepID=A0A835ZGX7_9STRA|nr:hypothetical protein JKP88DRAFT_243031 [Tribonema minus]
MVGVVGVYEKKCAGFEDGVPCTVQPIFGRAGRRPTHCATHKEDGMVDVHNKKYVGSENGVPCTMQACFGHVGPRPQYTHCATHKLPNMVNIRVLRQLLRQLNISN